MLTHEERLELIHRPLSIRYFTTNYPWGGCATVNHFYSPGDPEYDYAERPYKGEEGTKRFYGYMASLNVVKAPAW